MARQTFFTSRFILALIAIIFIVIFGLGGGFKTAFNLGDLVSKVPVWFWLVIALIWLVNSGRRR